MPEALAVIYRFLRLSELVEEVHADVRLAFDRACEHLVDESAAPLEIVRGSEVVLDSYDIYGMCECAVDWKDDEALHPLSSGEAGGAQ